MIGQQQRQLGVQLARPVGRPVATLASANQASAWYCWRFTEAGSCGPPPTVGRSCSSRARHGRRGPVPGHALFQEARTQPQPTKDLPRALGEAAGTAAGANGVVIIQHPHAHAMPRQVQRRRQSTRPPPAITTAAWSWARAGAKSAKRIQRISADLIGCPCSSTCHIARSRAAAQMGG